MPAPSAPTLPPRPAAAPSVSLAAQTAPSAGGWSFGKIEDSGGDWLNVWTRRASDGKTFRYGFSKTAQRWARGQVPSDAEIAVIRAGDAGGLLELAGAWSGSMPAPAAMRAPTASPAQRAAPPAKDTAAIVGSAISQAIAALAEKRGKNED